MECDICRTLAQQLRSYEMEIEDACNGSSTLRAGVTAGSLLNSALEEASKTKLLYQHHRESFHKSARPCPAIQSSLYGSGCARWSSIKCRTTYARDSFLAG